MPDILTIPGDWSETEKGNTLLQGRDGENLLAWITLPGGRKLEIEFSPDCSPALDVRILSAEAGDDTALAKRINTDYAGWYVRRCNVQGVKVEGDYIAEEE